MTKIDLGGSGLSMNMTRRAVLAALGAGAGAGLASTLARAATGKGILFFNGAWSLQDPFHSALIKGGSDFVAALGAPNVYQSAIHGNDSALQIAQIEQLAAKRSQFDAIVVTSQPVTPDNAVPVARAAKRIGAYLITEQFKLADTHPWEVYDNWICHLTYNYREGARQSAMKLFEAMGGKGNIAYLEGAVTDTAAHGRTAGMKDAVAKFPGIKLLETQPGDWERTKGYNITQSWLAKYGDDLHGIFGGSDDMALGALAALQGAGKAGKILIAGIDAEPPAVQAIVDRAQTGFIATVDQDSYWLGMIGPALGWAAFNGKFDPSKLPHEKRDWFAATALITQENAAQFIDGSGGVALKGGFETVKGGEPDPVSHVAEVKEDVWARFTGPAVIDWD